MTFSKRTLLIGSGLIGSGVLIAGGLGAGAFFVGSAQAAIQVGAPAPAFSAPDAGGAARTLSQFAGRTLVLEWTNRGCPFVRKHYDGGDMQRLQQEASEAGAVWLQVISSAPGHEGYLDGAGALAQARADNAHATATLLDPSGAMGHAYGARNTPHMFVINAQGVLVYQGAIDDDRSARRGSLDGAHNYVRAALADIAAGRPVAVAETTPYGCSVKYAR